MTTSRRFVLQSLATAYEYFLEVGEEQVLEDIKELGDDLTVYPKIMRKIGEATDKSKDIPKEFVFDVDRLPEMGYEDIFGIESGIYFIYTADYEQLLYVGQSGHRLRRRVMQHINKLEHLGTYVGDSAYSYARYKVIPVPKENLKEVEEYYIKTLQPLLNMSKNPRKDKKHFDLWFMEKIEEYDEEEQKKSRSVTLEQGH